MPVIRNPVPTAMRSPDTVNTNVDGDQTNRNNLYVELAPGATPNLTLGYLHDLVAGIVHPGATTRVANAIAFDFTASPPLVILPGPGTAITAGHNIAASLDVTHGATLSSVSVSIHPDSHGSLPANMPFLRVYKTAFATGTATQIGSTATDSSANTTAYDAAHTITVGGLTEVIDRSAYSYHTEFFAESGANSDDNTKYLGTSATFTV